MTTDLRTRDPGPELPGLARTLDLAAEQEFDLGALRVGIDGLVVRRRRRRRQLTAAVAATATAAVLGGSTWLLSPGRDLGQVAQPSPPPTAAPSEPSAQVAPTTTPSAGLAYEHVPDDVVLAGAEVGRGLSLQLDLLQYADIPVVAGQACNQGLDGLVPTGGRTVSYYDPEQEQDGSVSVNVTVWAPGTGSQALDEVARDTGRCRWLDPDPGVVDGPWEGEGRLLVQGQDVFGAASYRAVAQVEDVLVGVEVIDPRGADEAQFDAQRIADLVVDRVARSEMPAGR